MLTLQTYNAQLLISKIFHPLEYINIIKQVDKTTNRMMMKKRRTLSQKLRKLKIMQRKPIDEGDDATNHTKHIYERIHNFTNINLNDNEKQLIEKGLKHNLAPKNNKNEFNRHLFEIENAILNTDKIHQEDIRTLVINEISIKNIEPKIETPNTSSFKTLENLKKKLIEGNAIITKADKGNTVVLIYKSEYDQKIEEYISMNNIIQLTNDL